MDSSANELARRCAVQWSLDAHATTKVGHVLFGLVLAVGHQVLAQSGSSSNPAIGAAFARLFDQFKQVDFMIHPFLKGIRLNEQELDVEDACLSFVKHITFLKYVRLDSSREEAGRWFQGELKEIAAWVRQELACGVSANS